MRHGRIFWKLRKAGSSLILRASVFGVLAVATALAAYYFKGFISEDFSDKIGADAVDSLLNIIASSMLAVTTFSLSTMVSAYSAATTNVTPRSTKLLLEDKVSQTVLSTFLGAFIFSLVGIIALRIGIYGSNGRVILFIVTIGVLIAVIVFLIRWIEYLSRLGRVGETINRVEEATMAAVVERASTPYLGGRELTRDLAAEIERDPAAVPVYTSTVGYVEFIDIAAVSALAEANGLTVAILSIPGTFQTPSRPLALVTPSDGKHPDDSVLAKISSAFMVGGDRSFEQDPRFGMIVLCEIASRALSPATNDPGTAIDVIGTMTRVLDRWARIEPREDVPYPRLLVIPISVDDIIEDSFLPIARDGAGVREVGLSLQKALLALTTTGRADFATAAREMSKEAVERMRDAVKHPRDATDIERIAATIQNQAPTRRRD